MSKTVKITSTAHFSQVTATSTIVVVDFHADWCGPCKQIAPMFEQLSAQLSRPNKITFTKINTDEQQQLAAAYGVSALPTFMVFKNARVVQTIKGADPKKLNEVVKKLAVEANAVGDGSAQGGFGDAAGSVGDTWYGSELPKGYRDVTDQVDLKGIEVLNRDSDVGTARTFFDKAAPSKGEPRGADWVASEVDQQLMIYIPFQSTLKVHSIQITAQPPFEPPIEEDEGFFGRPRHIKLFTNRPHILDFEEADGITATQEVHLQGHDWNIASGRATATIELRFVKFQNVSSLVLFVVDNDQDESEQTMIDRIRIIGETGEKRDPGKLEKLGDED